MSTEETIFIKECGAEIRVKPISPELLNHLMPRPGVCSICGAAGTLRLATSTREVYGCSRDHLVQQMELTAEQIAQVDTLLREHGRLN